MQKNVFPLTPVRLQILAHEKLVFKVKILKKWRVFLYIKSLSLTPPLDFIFTKNKASSVFVCFESRTKNNGVIGDNSS